MSALLYLITKNRAKKFRKKIKNKETNCNKSRVHICKCSQGISVVSSLPFLLFCPLHLSTGTTKASFYLWERHLTLTSSLKSHTESSKAPLGREFEWDERCVLRGGSWGEQTRLKTQNLAGCYFLWAVLSTGEDVIAHLTCMALVEVFSLLHSHCEERKFKEKRKRGCQASRLCVDVTTLSPLSIWIVFLTWVKQSYTLNSSCLAKCVNEKQRLISISRVTEQLEAFNKTHWNTISQSLLHF